MQFMNPAMAGAMAGMAPQPQEDHSVWGKIKHMFGKITDISFVYMDLPIYSPAFQTIII